MENRYRVFAGDYEHWGYQRFFVLDDSQSGLAVGRNSDEYQMVRLAHKLNQYDHLRTVNAKLVDFLQRLNTHLINGGSVQPENGVHDTLRAILAKWGGS